MWTGPTLQISTLKLDRDALDWRKFNGQCPLPLPEHRQKYIQRCADELYKWQATNRPASNPFILHDGPPYANGDLHVGHALNKILKDMILRVKVQQGYRVQYVPGWDCHGLPIELKALGGRAEGQEQMTPAEVRALARELAATTVESQMRGFREFGVMADWDKRWETMQPSYVADQLRLFQRMVSRGLIYRRHKPVYWSPSSRTALAEAELEYNENHVSLAAYVKMPLTGDLEALGLDPDTSLLIWTTTPWTLPANQAIAVHKDLVYLAVKFRGDTMIIAADALGRMSDIMAPEVPAVLTSLVGEQLLGASYLNKLQGSEAQPQPIIHADFVSADSGSGLVHLAPGHGFEDYEVCKSLGLPAVSAVDGAGIFAKDICPANTDIPRQGAGADVLKGGSKVILQILGSDVLHSHKHKHKYPYDWRTKEPIVVRATAQWFADVASIKKPALEALNDVNFIPLSGQARLESFIKGRSEWCISRQRAWGVPIPAFYDSDIADGGEAIMTEETIDHVIRTVEQRGVDAWWSDAADEEAWIPESLQGRNLRRGTDTMDVWFDSGSSWTQTEGRADVYLEGTDQHRGWFQSSLLTKVATRPDEDPVHEAPFKSLITHGFTLDAHGKKMSKSLGNVISPMDVIEGKLIAPRKHGRNKQRKQTQEQNQSEAAATHEVLGPDALRLLVASSDYTKDIVISERTLSSIHTSLRKFRSIFKILLGSMERPPRQEPFDAVDQIAMLHLQDALSQVGRHYDSFEFYKGFAVLNYWVSQQLSAIYLEALKDKLYCGGDAANGNAALVPMFDGLCRMLAPVAPLIVEEAWDHAPEWLKETIPHPLQRLYNDPLVADPKVLTIPEAKLRAVMPVLEAARNAINAAAELGRADKNIGQSLQSAVTLYSRSETVIDALGLLGEKQLAAFYVVSCLKINPETPAGSDDWTYSAKANIEAGESRGKIIKAVVRHPSDHKCPRCWRYVAVEEDALCERCEDVIVEDFLM
ncbi:hypothetical protein PpBr36_00660 [Pyricularia pennisetigena]|uniref:hypothetical protein n=1 Tax=Pyricularia pennisetigena TaxID=1578925 RepID=UPI001150852D|nr:hypothetical protein PpBr36_00660 [Pyricularia pennisetigena]TLS29593.1 hypothetical protein PpBr36_00660 [Pyricularia pennisetigena]